MSSKILDVRDLKIAFGEDRTVVSGVSFDLQRGEMVGLFGPSGAGKSLTLWSLIGLLPKEAQATGSLEVYNEESEQIHIHPPYAQRRLAGQKITCIPQNPFTSLNPVLRCGTQIAEMPVLKSFPDTARRQKILAHLKHLGFEDPERIYEAYPFELSGGQLQRVVIAMATLGDPVVILADEPTTALDVQTEQEVLEFLKGWVREGNRSVLIVSHDAKMLARYCTRIYHVSNGTVAREMSPGQLLETARHVHEPRPADDITPKDVLCVVDKVSVRYTGRSGRRVDGLREVSLQIMRNEVLGIVGATGCGKSSLARVLTGLVAPRSGSVHFDGQPLDFAQYRSLRRRIQMIFQDPYSALYPHWTIGAFLHEALRKHHGRTSAEREAEIHEILAAVGLPREFLDRYPHQLSGGERQRVQIARALLVAPDMLICDEITSGLDAPVRRQILELLLRAHADRQMAMLIISHDLDVIREIAHRTIVMDAGAIVESGWTSDLFQNPSHPVTRRLVELASQT